MCVACIPARFAGMALGRSDRGEGGGGSSNNKKGNFTHIFLFTYNIAGNELFLRPNCQEAAPLECSARLSPPFPERPGNSTAKRHTKQQELNCFVASSKLTTSYNTGDFLNLRRS